MRKNPERFLKIQFCKNGHDTFSCGRYKDGACKLCSRDSVRKYLKTEKGKVAQRRVFKSAKFIFWNYRGRARRQHIPFELTLEDFVARYDCRTCVYCGSHIETVGFDRIDSSKGYVLDNIADCCGDCNYMKSDSSTEQFLKHIKTINNWQLKNSKQYHIL